MNSLTGTRANLDKEFVPATNEEVIEALDIFMTMFKAGVEPEDAMQAIRQSYRVNVCYQAEQAITRWCAKR